jgi:surfeit locus 1 family protein
MNTAPAKTHRISIWATLLTLLGLAILITLGTWQLQRLEWKNDMIAQLDRAYNQDTPQALDLNEPEQNYAYGRISGTLLTDKAFILGPPFMRDEKPGYNMMVPIKNGEHTLLVNMGWTPDALEDQPLQGLNGKTVSFHGLIKRSRWNAFTPANIPEKDVWYRLDMKEIAAAKGLENLYPSPLIADQSSHDFGEAFFSEEAKNRPSPNNNHLQYVFFWYAMAGALALIYILRFVVKQKD